MTRWNGRWWLALAAALGLVAAACGSDDGEDEGALAGDEAADAVDAPETDDDDADDPDPTAGDEGASADPDVRIGEIDGAEVRLRAIETPEAPGPPQYSQVNVLEHGDADAENVLVLVPGTLAGAAYFSPVALDITDELPDWQVWSVDRRENALEDHSVREQRLNDEITSEEAFDHYVGWIGDSEVEDPFEPRGGLGADDESVAFAHDWGMEVAVNDLQAVIEEAASLGGEVVLGGHSLGGSITVAYATWDFDGRPGGDDLSGIALIDGGSGAGQAPRAEEAEDSLAELAEGSPFNDLLGLGIPWVAGAFNSLGAGGVLVAPDEPSVGWQSPLLPDNLKPDVQPTNAAQYGHALDAKTSPEGLALVQMQIGRLADEGEPRGWVNDELVPVERAARMFSGADGLAEVDGTAWYHPARLNLDSGAVNGGIDNPAQEVLEVRAIHGEALDIPIYALETMFGAGRVLAGAELLAEQSGIPEDDVTLVDESDRLTHTDPMGVDTEQNPLRETLVPFLRAIG